MVERIQKLNMKKNSKILFDCISKELQYKGEINEPLDYSVKFVSLQSMSELEQCDVESKNATTRLTNAQADELYFNMGVVDASEIRETLKQGEDFTISDTLNDDGITQLVPDVSNLNVGTIDQDDNSQGLEAAAIIVVKDGSVLTGLRVEPYGDGHLMCGPGGHIEPGENLARAAIREAYEEFGITCKNLVPVGICYKSSEDYCDTMIYLCTEWDGVPIADDDEMYNVEWVPIDKLDTYPLFPPFKESVDLLMQVIGGADDG